MTAAAALARIIVLGRHRRHETVEAGLAGQLRMECRGDHVALADGHDPAIFEPGEDVDAGTGSLDYRGADEDAVNGL